MDDEDEDADEDGGDDDDEGEDEEAEEEDEDDIGLETVYKDNLDVSYFLQLFRIFIYFRSELLNGSSLRFLHI